MKMIVILGTVCIHESFSNIVNVKVFLQILLLSVLNLFSEIKPFFVDNVVDDNGAPDNYIFLYELNCLV